MVETRCKRCNRILSSEKSIARGYGSTCYRIHLLESKQENNDIKELIDRVRKLELDNTFMKHQLKNKVFINSPSQDSQLDWERRRQEARIHQEALKKQTELQERFGNVVKELKSIFDESFEISKVLKPRSDDGIHFLDANKMELVENIYK